MKKHVVIAGVLLFCFAFAKAQLGFCSGVSGEAIFLETFGTGVLNGPPLPTGVTSYSFLNFAPNDGAYTITANTGQRPGWWITGDHTGDANGKMLLVNASFNPGLFYRTPISGLCENTPYEFSAWILNILRGTNNTCTGNEVPIQVRFEIWDDTDTTLLASGTMPPRFAETTVNWVQYGLTFTTSAGQNSVILKMINEGRGGCGNDLAIDDIAFKTCGDATRVATGSGGELITQCQGAPAQSFILNASTSTSVYASPVYQWQSSTDGVIFTDVVGATTAVFTTDPLTSEVFYRVKVAEDVINLTNSQCVNFSNVWRFSIINVPEPLVTQTNVVACHADAGTLEVRVAAGETVSWFTDPVGGNAIATGTTFTTSTPGIYYAETLNTSTSCRSVTRSAITFSQVPLPVVVSRDFTICEGDVVTLDPAFAGGSYVWNTGENTQTIAVQASGVYTCTVVNDSGCEAVATFNVSTIPLPEISGVDLTGDQLIIRLVNSGNFSFSIDGVNYQPQPVFDISGLLEVVIRARNNDGCEVVRQRFMRIKIPEFFTPNNDGFNDIWEIKGIHAFPGSRLEIYDRYGKLLHVANDAVIGWDGLFNNQPLPSADYWYKLYYEGQVLLGHFSLKR